MTSVSTSVLLIALALALALASSIGCTSLYPTTYVGHSYGTGYGSPNANAVGIVPLPSHSARRGGLVDAYAPLGPIRPNVYGPGLGADATGRPVRARRVW